MHRLRTTCLCSVVWRQLVYIRNSMRNRTSSHTNLCEHVQQSSTSVQSISPGVGKDHLIEEVHEPTEETLGIGRRDAPLDHRDL